jgi:hypothetical protein
MSAHNQAGRPCLTGILLLLLLLLLFLLLASSTVSKSLLLPSLMLLSDDSMINRSPPSGSMVNHSLPAQHSMPQHSL